MPRDIQTIGAPQENSPGWRFVARTAAGAVAVVAVAMASDIYRRSDQAIEAMTPPTLGVAVTASLLALAGAIVLLTNRHHDLALLSSIASMLLVAALVLSIFGVLVLPLVILTVVLLGRRLSGRQRPAIALASGPIIALGLAALLAIWVQPPLVECRDNGVTTNSRPWWDSSSGSGTGSGSSEGSSRGTSPEAGVSTGSMETPVGRYQYRCEGDKLVEFRRA